MSHTNAAARAETQHSWSKALRITEAAAECPGSPKERMDIPKERMDIPIKIRLSTGMICLRTVWCWFERKRLQQVASKRLRVAETISLGEKRTLSIVTVDGAQYLIGSSSGGVQLLTKLGQDFGNEVSS